MTRKVADDARMAELLAIFDGRKEIPSIGQLSAAEVRRLTWAVNRGFVRRVRAYWPWWTMGTCMKTWYVLEAEQ